MSIQFIVLLLIVGIVCLFIEMIVPGFGIPGAVGIFCILVASIMTIMTVPFGIVYVAGGLIILGMLFYFFFKRICLRQNAGGLILRETLDMQQQEFGDLEKLIGKDGTVIVPLRPFGMAEFNNNRFNVYSEGAFVPKGRSVRVTNVEKDRIYVKEMN